MADRRPYRVIFEEDRDDDTTRRGTITAANLEKARQEARAVAQSGRRAEVHYVSDSGERQQIEEHLP